MMYKNPHEGKSFGWLQWKGTDVCIDIHCECGHHSHYDGDFMYYIRCPECKRIWECNGYILLEEPEEPPPNDECVQNPLN